MTFEGIKPGDTIWYQSHRQFDLLLRAVVISVDHCSKNFCILKFYHETLEEEFEVRCMNRREADKGVATSKEALKAYLVKRFREEAAKTTQRIEDEIKKLRYYRGCIKTSIEKIEKL